MTRCAVVAKQGRMLGREGELGIKQETGIECRIDGRGR